jgi:hypothetical protein
VEIVIPRFWEKIRGDFHARQNRIRGSFEDSNRNSHSDFGRTLGFGLSMDPSLCTFRSERFRSVEVLPPEAMEFSVSSEGQRLQSIVFYGASGLARGSLWPGLV